jgi:hypothetical protein
MHLAALDAVFTKTARAAPERRFEFRPGESLLAWASVRE